MRIRAAAVIGFFVLALSVGAAPPEAAPREYVVACAVAPDDPYFAAAKALSEHRKAEVVHFDPADLEALRAALAERAPRFVAVVAKPETIDTNFIRQFLAMSTRLDADHFPDFAYGYVTGATAEAARRFVETGIKAEKEGLPKKFLYSYVTSHGGAVPGQGPSWLRAAGWVTDALGFGYGDPGRAKAFVGKHLGDLRGRGLIQMTGCGDPERIWLFADQRNMESDKHWPFDPAKVGQNPGGEMFWIDAPMLTGLDLYPAVLTSGTCHCGSLDRVFVEGDIVSTFGVSDKVERYRIPPGKSLGLAYLASGVSAAILPVGPNHGWRTNVEVLRMFATGEPLGRVMKSCYDELVLAEAGEVRPGLYDDEGHDADHGIEKIMRGGSANRVLYGDPAFAPFPRIEGLASPAVHPLVRVEDGTLRFEAEVTAPFDYGEYTGSDNVEQFNRFGSRLLAAADLPGDALPFGVASVTLAGDVTGGPVVDEIRWGVETDRGVVRLHVAVYNRIAAGLPGALGTEKGQRVSFRVVPAKSEAERLWAGVTKLRTEGGQAEAALAQPWGYEWEDWRFRDVLQFVEDFLEKHGEGQKVKFEFEKDALPLVEKKVSIKLDREPLRAGLDRACAALGLTYTVDSARNVVRFSKAK